MDGNGRYYSNSNGGWQSHNNDFLSQPVLPANNNNNNSNNNRKRAAKRRIKHDLPGPAGNWFRSTKKKTTTTTAAVVNNKSLKKSIKAAALLLSSKEGTIIKYEKEEDSSSRTNNNTAGSGMTQQDDINNKEAHIENNETAKSPPDKNNIKSDPDDDHHTTSPNDSANKQQQQQQQLFHDHSSDLHESSTWNMMCSTLSRIVPPSNLLLSSYDNNINSSFSTYKRTIRNFIPREYALIYEIHEGKYDTNHIGNSSNNSGNDDAEVIEGNVGLYANDLTIPNYLVGYVASIQCHAHSDWTALLVDEMHSVSSGSSSSGSSSNNKVGRGIICWIEERVVKQHAGWVRPGAVWMLEGAKLALFTSLNDDDDDDHNEEEQYANGTDTNNASNTNVIGTDVSPSTDNVRGGSNIDRMILVGESSLVYAWTPEEAASTFGHDEFVNLTERRLNLALPEDDVDVIDVEEEGIGSNNNDEVIVEKRLVVESSTLSKPKDAIEIDNDGNSSDELVLGAKEHIRNTTKKRSLTPSQPRQSSSARKLPGQGTKLNGEALEQASASARQTTQNVQVSPRENVVVQHSGTEGSRKLSESTEVAAAKQKGPFLSESILEVDSTNSRTPTLHGGNKTPSTANKSDDDKELSGTSNNITTIPLPHTDEVVVKAKRKAANGDPLGLSQFKATEAKSSASEKNVASNLVATSQAHSKTSTMQQSSKKTISHMNPYATAKTMRHDDAVIPEDGDPVVLELTPPRQAPPPSNNTCVVQPRPVSSESALPLHAANTDTSHPQRSMDEVPFSESANSELKRSNKSNHLRSNDSFDDMLDEDEDYISAVVPASTANVPYSTLTPKEQIKKQPSPNRLRIDTGDSFDDMLDEDDEDISCAGFTNASTSESNKAASSKVFEDPTAIAKPKENNTSINPVVSSTSTQAQGAFLFDSLDGDDLDILDEED